MKDEYLRKLLQRRGVPEIPAVSPRAWSRIRAGYVKTLCEREYGLPVPVPESEHFEEKLLSEDGRFCAGKAAHLRVTARTRLPGGEFSFPFTFVRPVGRGPFPFVVLLNFRPNIPDLYFPVEEIVDSGFAAFQLCYEDITKDNDDFTDGLAGVALPKGQRAASASGKLQMWAWGASRALDYALGQKILDGRRAAVVGHSRLGKTALVAGMLDRRFTHVAANDSGCGGDALFRGKGGEQIAKLARVSWFWFCERFKDYAATGVPEGFDNHMLLATIAPRTLLLGAAEEDSGADPISQFLSACAASRAWENFGRRGLVAQDRLAKAGDDFSRGGIAFHLRKGMHFFSRDDWHAYLPVIKR